TEDQVTALFHKARAAEYQAVMQGCREILSHLDRDRAKHRTAFAQLRGKLEGIKRELDRIHAIDYLQSPAGQRATSLWETTAKRLREAEAPPPPRGGRHPTAPPPPGSPRVPRPRPPTHPPPPPPPPP